MGIGIIKHIKYLVECLLQVIYFNDDICSVCSQICLEDELLCKGCIKGIKCCEDTFIMEKSYEKYTYYSAAYYAGVIPELILKLKYKGDFRCGKALANLMAKTINNKAIKFDLISYVPASSKSFKSRGYNQSEYLAKAIGNSFGVPVVCCLKKTRETKDQIGLSRIMRWDNLTNCFKTTNDKKISGKNILLIDDVITTGATAFYCASELKKGGANKVTILTAAKSRI